jgi:uncharacterized protein (DUF1697 family)
VSTRWLALLRGINVGGKNLVKMGDLRSCFEELGFDEVATYIASGNVLFTASGARLVERIEAALGARFGYPASVVLRSRAQMAAVVSKAPPGFGATPAEYRYDVIFLKEPLTAATAMKSVLLREGVDQAWAGAGALYFARLAARAASSLLPRLVSMPVYRSMTIRNWNTTTKLAALMR